MKKRIATPHPIRCSFCGRGQDEVARLVSGPSVYICSECVKLCNDILEGSSSAKQPASGGQLPKPAEIKRILDDYVVGQNLRQEDARGRRLQPLQAHLLAVASGRTSSSRSRTSCSSARPAPARRCSRGRWRASSRCRSPSSTRPASPRPATSARTSRTSWSACCSRRTSTWSTPSTASSTSTRSTRSRARARTRASRATCRAKACSRRCSRSSRARSPTFRRRAGASIRSRSTSRSTPKDILFVCGGAFEGLEKIVERARRARRCSASAPTSRPRARRTSASSSAWWSPRTCCATG